MFYKIVFWIMVTIGIVLMIGFALMYLMACAMSSAPHTCSLPFIGYIN